jgi:hypothetical protein
MGSYFDLAAGNAALKEHYDDQKVENLAYDDNPVLAMMPKKKDATGKYIPIPVVYEVSQGSSHNFAIAQANQSPGLIAEFMLTLKPDHALATLTNQAMEASADNAGAFLDFSTLFVDLAIQGAANRFATELFRAGTGTRGGISAIAGGVITLTNAADVVQFGINQTLQAAAVDGGAPRAALGYVTGRNVMAGTITVSAISQGGPAGSPALWAANDVLLVQGDSNTSFRGFGAWLPMTAPGAFDNFYGVNRSIDSRLYGLAYGMGAQQPVEEAIIDAAMIVRREKGKPRHLFFNYGTESALLKALGTRREYCDWGSEDAEIGFRGVKIQGPAGPIECFADRNCPAATGFLVQLPSWKIYSLGDVPKIFRYGDGLEMLRLANADASEVRVGEYAEIGCNAPGWNSQLAFSV